MGEKFKRTHLHAADQIVTEGDVRKAAKRVGLIVDFKAADRNGNRRVDLKTDDQKFLDFISYNVRGINALRDVRDQVVKLGNKNRGLVTTGATLVTANA